MAKTATSHPLVARRYSDALFDVAGGPGLDGVARDLERLKAMLATSEDLRRLTEEPTIEKSVRIAAIEAVLARAEFSDVARKFVGVVTANGRLGLLPVIIDTFLREVASRRGVRTVDVRTAQPLSPEQSQKLEHVLNVALSAKTTLDVQVDPDLLGGVVVRVGSRLIDASLKTKLEILGRHLKTAA